MEIVLSENGETMTVQLKGDIYMEHGDELHKAFNSILGKKPAEVVIDLQGLKSITSSGIGKIVLLYKGLQKQNGSLSIRGVNHTIMEVFRIVKLDKLVAIEPS